MSDLTNPESVPLFVCTQREDGQPDMAHSERGAWVRYRDYEALSARLAEVEAERDEANERAKDMDASAYEWESRADAAEARLREVRDALDYTKHTHEDLRTVLLNLLNDKTPAD